MILPRLWIRWFVNLIRNKREITLSVLLQGWIFFHFNDSQIGYQSLIEDFTTINNGVEM
jgi:hypothetical protein